MLAALATAAGGGPASREKPAAAPVRILMSSTNGPIAAGIVLLPEQESEKCRGIVARPVGIGTGEAIKIGKSGAVDLGLVLVHARVPANGILAGISRRTVGFPQLTGGQGTVIRQISWMGKQNTIFS